MKIEFADTLSRRMTYATLSTMQFDELEEWETEVQNDPTNLSACLNS